MSHLLLGILIAVGGLLLLLFVFASAMAVKTFGRREKTGFDIRKKLAGREDALARLDAGAAFIGSTPCEEVSVLSYDGLRLAGNLYAPGEGENRFVICFHGYHSLPTRDMATTVQYFTSKGFGVLMPYQRAHGKSEGKYLTFGVKERYDCKSWCEYLVKRYGENIKILLDGVSMGAATVTMAADRRVGLPPQVRAVLADCGFTSPWDAVCHVARTNYHLSPFPAVSAMRLAARLFCGFDMKGASSREAVQNTDLPIFFAHGEIDNFVPYKMGVELSGLCTSEKVFFHVPGADHGLSFLIDNAGYDRAFTAFAGKYFREA